MQTIVVLPTYNEKENIEEICNEILRVNDDIEILVVDDNSPDGTGEIVKQIQNQNDRVHLLSRLGTKGRGYAGREGFREALKYNPYYILEMDADFSHKPCYIPDFIEKIKENDVVIGSRYIKGGQDEDRSFLRKIISFLSKKYLRFVLGMNTSDPTSGFRIFKKEALEIVLPYLEAKDPFIVTEVLYYCIKKGLKIKEVPISFVNRKAGSSKLGIGVLLNYLLRVIKLRYR